MQPTNRSVVIAAALTAIGLGLAGPAAAKKQKVVEWYQYTVAFTCGANDADFSRVVPGDFATAVNLYNATAGDTTLRKNLALSFPPETQTAGVVSDAIEEILPANSALQVDCEEILFGFTYAVPPPATDYIQGFLVIESDKPLEVQAVHSALGAADEVSIDVERIAERRVLPRPFAPPQRVVICHYPPGNPGNAQTLTVDAAALPAHKAHGDTLGPCPNGGSSSGGGDDDEEDDD
jgi:hypothetical protein